MNLKLNIAKLLLKITPFKLKKVFYNDKDARYNHKTECYSQEGEDLFIWGFFKTRRFGFYVDIGAYHPIKYSNTYLLYKNGWRGINIDARPGSMDLFEKYRPNDNNLEAAISSTEKELCYYMFDEPGLNSFSEKLSTERNKKTSIHKIVNKIQLKTERLDKIMDKCVSASKKIDILTIDVEGAEFDVLSSMDWSKYKPTLIVVETLKCKTISDVLNTQVAKYLIDKGYIIVGKTIRTSFFTINDYE